MRIADYRGCFLSLHNGYYIECDGVEYPRELQKFEVNGKELRDFEEIKTCVWEHWNFLTTRRMSMCGRKRGGLTPGMHRIKLQQSGPSTVYMPWDEEWLVNPPVPGHGAGAGKTVNICEFELELQKGA